MTLKIKTRQERLSLLSNKAVDLILKQSAGVFERDKVSKIIVESCREAGKPLRTKKEVDQFAVEVDKFIDKFKYVYDYVAVYRYQKQLTLELVDKIYSLYVEQQIWLEVLDRRHNAQLVEAEIASLLSN